MKDVQIKLLEEECVVDMVQRRRSAVMKDVLTEYRNGEYVSDMVPLLRKGFVDMKDAPTLLSEEEFVKGTVQKLREVPAVMKDVPTTLSKVEFVKDMVHHIYQTRKICNYEGCTNVARKGGVCCRHSAREGLASMKDVPTCKSKEELSEG